MFTSVQELRAPSRQLRPRGLVAALVLAGIAATGYAAAPGAGSGGSIENGSPAPRHSARPNTAPEIRSEPTKGAVEIFVRRAAGEGMKALLVRSGSTAVEAAVVSDLIDMSAPAGLAEDMEIAVLLGDANGEQTRSLERVSLRMNPATRLVVFRDGKGQFRVSREGVSVDGTPRRVTGSIGASPFWSLRSAGVPAEDARSYLEALATRINVREDLRTEDRFDLVFEQLQTADGQRSTGKLLYAGIHRRGGNPLHLVRWTAGGRTEWLQPGNARQTVSGFVRPVSGSVSSPFGRRFHPILRIGRFHSGVDFRARLGSPVAAAADGTVLSAGWNGGHGRQVRLVHAEGISTSYSHLSMIAAAPGTFVRRGDVIGYVGSSGLSTGPHLHYEVRQGGRAVDPLRFVQSTTLTLNRTEQAALAARLEQLRSI